MAYSIIIMLATLLLWSIFILMVPKTERESFEKMSRYAIHRKDIKTIYIKADSKQYLNRALYEYVSRKEFHNYSVEIDVLFDDYKHVSTTIKKIKGSSQKKRN